MTEMTEADRKAFDAFEAQYGPLNSTAKAAWRDALTHARGKQDPVGPDRAMYVCSSCSQEGGDFCLYPRDMMRASSGEWYCEDCAREAAWADGRDADAKLPLPPELYAAPPAESEEVARLRAENERLTNALLFYADEDTYNVKYETEPCGCCGSSRIDIDEDQGEIARAALAASPAPVVDTKAPEAVINAVCASPAIIKPKVKALGPWRRGYCDNHVTIEQASFGGLYQVRVLNGVINLDWPDRSPPSVFGTMEEAKAAAQADYERRILSAIEGEGDE